MTLSGTHSASLSAWLWPQGSGLIQLLSVKLQGSLLYMYLSCIEAVVAYPLLELNSFFAVEIQLLCSSCPLSIYMVWITEAILLYSHSTSGWPPELPQKTLTWLLNLNRFLTLDSKFKTTTGSAQNHHDSLWIFQSVYGNKQIYENTDQIQLACRIPAELLTRRWTRAKLSLLPHTCRQLFMKFMSSTPLKDSREFIDIQFTFTWKLTQFSAW